jgi:hypothetical protein
MRDINRDTNRLTAAAAIIAAWMSAGGGTAAAQSEPDVVCPNGKTITLVARESIVGTLTLVHGGVRHSAIPESFWGRWAPDTEVCKLADKSVIALTATTYVSSEASCTVDWVAETAGARGPIYSAHIQCLKRAGKAQRTTSSLIILPRDANQISVGPEFGNLKIYQRCSPNEPAATQ